MSVPHGLFAEADDIQAVPVQVPTLVVEKILEEGLPPSSGGPGSVAEGRGGGDAFAGVELLRNDLD